MSGCAEAAGEAHETEPHSWAGLKKRELYPAERSCRAHPARLQQGRARVVPTPSSSPWKGWRGAVAWQPQQGQRNKGSAVGEPCSRARERLGCGSRAAAANGAGGKAQRCQGRVCIRGKHDRRCPQLKPSQGLPLSHPGICPE